MIDRVVLIVMDGVGIGALPDAGDFGDEGSNTLVNIAIETGALNLPNMAKMGLGNIESIPGVEPVNIPIACYGKLAEISKGKDTTTGHWEITGVISKDPFPTFPQGFPAEIINQFEKAIKRKVLGNVVASGTEIVKALGKEHMKTGYPIVYTSADSVFQIAAHEDVIPVEELYEMCRIARKILTGPHAVGRVIARPFIGTSPENFKRTGNRRDFSLSPPSKTLLDMAVEKGYEVFGIGKINDIFNFRGITESVHPSNNDETVSCILNTMKKSFSGIIFGNLGDFDTLYGHRNNPVEYKAALEKFDSQIPEIINKLKPSDLLIITADHGCDPTTPSTDHSREYVPILIYNKSQKFCPGKNIGTRKTFADIGATIAELLEIHEFSVGTSFAPIIFNKGDRDSI